MNRDEQRVRVKARPPTCSRLGEQLALYPSEPGGGSWIGVNETGISVALVNWYAIPTKVRTARISRGEVVKSLLRTGQPDEARSLLGSLPLQRIDPFRLVYISPRTGGLTEWRWDLEQLRRKDFRWNHRLWASSGFDERGAQQQRRETFRAAMEQRSAGKRSWLRRLHRSHRPEAGPYSICMHRDDAVTVSYTEVVVSGRSATMLYQAGGPCSAAPTTVKALPLAG